MSQTVIKFHFTPAHPTLRSRLMHIRHRVALAWQEASTRRCLGQLDDRALSDIGVSRAQAQFDSERPIWDLVPGLHR